MRRVPIWQTGLAVLLASTIVACQRQTPTESQTAAPRSTESTQATRFEPSDSPTRKPSLPKVETKLRFETAHDTGLEFQHVSGRSPQKYLPETMGGGVLIDDFNRDFAPDVLFINSGRFIDAKTIEPAPHRLFMNDGTGKFADQTEPWNLRNLGYGMGGAVGDFDNDGWPDVYLTTYDGQDQLLRNTGSAFENVTEKANLVSDGNWSTSAGFFDMENDGDLDLYVVKYLAYEAQEALPCYVQGFRNYCHPVMFDGERDRLYRNNGDGTFTDVTTSAGIPEGGKGLALAIGDVDRDGDADIYVANDTTSNVLLINNGTGKFEDKARALGVSHSNVGLEEAGMGVDFSDVNDDGLPDIVCTNYQNESTSIYLQQQRGYFMERSDGLGVGRTARQRLSFGVDFFDADNDGDEDLLVANGHIDFDVHKYQTGVTFGQQNTIYELRDGRFVDVSDVAGNAFRSTEPSRGMATSDLDNDGDLDVIVVNSHAKSEIISNQSMLSGNHVSIWLEGADCNRSAVGTIVEARIGESLLSREVVGCNSYLSSCDRRLHFGLGAVEQIDEVHVKWPGGARQTFDGLRAGGNYHLIQGQKLRRINPGPNL